MARVNLTEARINALKPDPTGWRRLELRDAIVPGLVVRAAAHRKTYVLHTRFPGATHPTRRAIAECGTISLETARATARLWIEQIANGIDPVTEARRRADVERRQRDADRVRQDVTFAAVAEDYLKRKVAGQRRAAEAGRIVRNILVKAWGNTPITDISRRDVVRLVEEINDRPAPVYAALVFAHARSLFGWVVNRGIYGVEQSPCERIKVGDLVSRRKQARLRVLSDDELLCFWKATGRMPYPWRQMFRLLLLSGARRNEAAGAKWGEFDLERKVWTIPQERFKSGVSHLIPLTADMLNILGGVPRFRKGDYVFSFTFGERPALILHQAKLKLDALMLCYLKALARLRGDDPGAVKLTPFVIHDLRRTTRTRLAALEVNDTVAEMVLGHSHRNPLQRVYDQHSYEPQMRKALEIWNAELRRIVSPPPSNVVPLRGQGV